MPGSRPRSDAGRPWEAFRSPARTRPAQRWAIDGPRMTTGLRWTTTTAATSLPVGRVRSALAATRVLGSSSPHEACGARTRTGWSVAHLTPLVSNSRRSAWTSTLGGRCGTAGNRCGSLVIVSSTWAIPPFLATSATGPEVLESRPVAATAIPEASRISTRASTRQTAPGLRVAHSPASSTSPSSHQQTVSGTTPATNTPSQLPVAAGSSLRSAGISGAGPPSRSVVISAPAAPGCRTSYPPVPTPRAADPPT